MIKNALREQKRKNNISINILFDANSSTNVEKYFFSVW